jgi:hypothetical protein
MYGTYLYAEFPTVQLGNHWNVFLLTGIHGIGYQFFHLLPATYHGDIAVNNLYDNVAAMGTLIKLGCHNLLLFLVLAIFVMDSSLNPLQIYVVSFVGQSFFGNIIRAVHNNYTIVTFVYQSESYFCIS